MFLLRQVAPETEAFRDDHLTAKEQLDPLMRGYQKAVGRCRLKCVYCGYTVEICAVSCLLCGHEALCVLLPFWGFRVLGSSS